MSDIPEFAPGSGLYLAATFLSLSPPVIPGLDLGFFGAPGCQMYIASFDIPLMGSLLTPGQSVWLQLPGGLPPGLEFHAQAFSMFTPNSLSGGQNAAGLSSSNAVRHIVQPW